MERYEGCLEMNELKHFGILRQKKGRRNGPPYPLKSAPSYPEAEEYRQAQRLKALAEAELNRRSDKKQNEDYTNKVYGEISEEELKAGRDVLNTLLFIAKKLPLDLIGAEYSPIIKGFIELTTDLTTGLYNDFIRDNGYPAYLRIKGD